MRHTLAHILSATVRQWTKPQRVAVLLLVLAAAIILVAAAWEWLVGFGGTNTLYAFFAVIALLSALLVATPWWSLQLVALGVVVWLGDLVLGYFTLSKGMLLLRGEWVLQLARQEDRLFVAGVPVALISLAVPVLVVLHWVVARRIPASELDSR